MPLPDDFFDEDVTYRIRLCQLVEESTFIAEGSKIHLCDSCGKPIWVSESQAIPPTPDDVVLTGDVNVCHICSKKIFERLQPTEVHNLDTFPEELHDRVKKFFGLK